jgi:2-oxoglutarate dehydrogenase E2 component (dihydrolipoamide succinyltransferase)
MPTDIKIPSVGESITEGTIARWLKKDGEPVRAGDPILELETEKATTEVPAPVAGTLSVSVPEGKTVAIGSVVGRIQEGAAPPRPAPVPTATSEQPKAPSAAHAAKQPAANESATLSPAARQLVADADLDVRQIAGTGRGGRILKEDVLTHLQQRTAPPFPLSPSPPGEETSRGKEAAPVPPPPEPTRDGRETRQRMSAIRQRIAERLVAAQQNAAILSTFNEADMSAVVALRARYKDSFQKKHGVGLGFMSFFVKASIEALKAFPVVNARIDGADVVYHNFYNIGVAVSTDKGLMVPVLRDGDRMRFAEIEKTLTDLTERARQGKIAVSDLQGGTFTITNGGVFGSLLSTPLLNPPQSGILGMHAIQKRPVVVDDQIVVRPMMYLALSYDHRLIDGREAVGFLVRVKECIEQPERMLLEI